MPLNANRMIKLATDHAQWFTEMVKPLLRTYMEHGYKHGFEDGAKATRERLSDPTKGGWIFVEKKCKD